MKRKFVFDNKERKRIQQADEADQDIPPSPPPEAERRSDREDLAFHFRRQRWVRTAVWRDSYWDIAPEGMRHVGSFRKKVSPVPGVDFGFKVDLGSDPAAARRHGEELIAKGKKAVKEAELNPLWFDWRVADDGRLMVMPNRAAYQNMDLGGDNPN